MDKKLSEPTLGYSGAGLQDLKERLIASIESCGSVKDLERTLSDLNLTAAWCSANMSYMSAQKVVRSAYETVNLLSVQPGTGMLQHDISGGRYQYRGTFL